jgi:hypothetical protein
MTHPIQPPCDVTLENGSRVRVTSVIVNRCGSSVVTSWGTKISTKKVHSMPEDLSDAIADIKSVIDQKQSRRMLCF